MPPLWGFLTRKYARAIVLLSGSLRNTRLSGKFETAVKSGFFMGKFEKWQKRKTNICPTSKNGDCWAAGKGF